MNGGDAFFHAVLLLDFLCIGGFIATGMMIQESLSKAYQSPKYYTEFFFSE